MFDSQGFRLRNQASACLFIASRQAGTQQHGRITHLRDQRHGRPELLQPKLLGFNLIQPYAATLQLRQPEQCSNHTALACTGPAHNTKLLFGFDSKGDTLQH